MSLWCEFVNARMIIEGMIIDTSSVKYDHLSYMIYPKVLTRVHNANVDRVVRSCPVGVICELMLSLFACICYIDCSYLLISLFFSHRPDSHRFSSIHPYFYTPYRDAHHSPTLHVRCNRSAVFFSELPELVDLSLCRPYCLAPALSLLSSYLWLTTSCYPS